MLSMFDPFRPESGKGASRRQEYEQIREAYLRQPDDATDADDWSAAEEWKAELNGVLTETPGRSAAAG